MSSSLVQQTYIGQDKGICGGQPRIDGTRIKVQHITLEYERLGWSADQICDAHPGLTLAQVHAAISYYYDHREEIDESIRKDEEFANRLREGLS
jgi:uncharacterized protein (DUF433 family)